MILHTWAPRLYFDDPALKDATNSANAEQDPKKRVATIQDILSKLVDYGPYVMLVQGKVQVVVRPSVQGYVYQPIGTARMLGVTK
jgi:ABC-type transport system substrate-binding protein